MMYRLWPHAIVSQRSSDLSSREKRGVKGADDVRAGGARGAPTRRAFRF
jgi:hypothetical protein